MSNFFILSCGITIAIIYILIFFSIYLWYNNRYKYFTSKDHYLINKHLLDETCEMYKNSIFVSKLDELKRSHNLDENSQLNAKQAFKRAEDKLLRNSALEIYKMLSKNNIRGLQMYYTGDTLTLIIINHLRE